MRKRGENVMLRQRGSFAKVGKAERPKEAFAMRGLNEQRKERREPVQRKKNGPHCVPGSTRRPGGQPSGEKISPKKKTREQ